MNHAGTSLLLLPQVLPLLPLQPRSSSSFLPHGPSAQPSTERTDHPVRLFTLSSTVSLLPWIVCGLKDRITPQECPLVFQTLHHLHLSTLQPFSLPTKIVCLENVLTMMHPEMSANSGVSSRWQEAWAHRTSLSCLYFQPQARSQAVLQSYKLACT